jgi:isocitrate dehydrogenase kinase/phosphatase
LTISCNCCRISLDGKKAFNERTLKPDEGGTMLESVFDELSLMTDAQEKERLIRELAQHPQETLGEAMRILGSLPKSRWKVAAQVI